MVLITDNGSDRPEKLSQYFSEKQLRVGLIHFDDPPKNPEKSSDEGVTHYYISKPVDGEVQACMDTLIQETKDISAFIHLSPISKDKGSELISLSESNSRILKTVFLIARHLGKPLSNSAKDGHSAFLTITNMDGQLGLDGYQSHDPISGGYAGLTKSLRLEWPAVFCRSIDVHPDIDTKTFVDIINSEMHDPDSSLAEVGYTSNGRYTLSAT